jgi:hypothetical protein
MQLELAENNSCSNPMLPAVDSETGRIYMINPETFLTLTPIEKRQFITELPEAMEAVDGAEGMGSFLSPDDIKERIQKQAKDFFNKAALLNPFVENVNANNITKIAPMPPSMVGPVSPKPPVYATMPPNMAPAPQSSLFVDFQADQTPWFAQTPVLIGAAVVLLALGYAIKR